MVTEGETSFKTTAVGPLMAITILATAISTTVVGTGGRAIVVISMSTAPVSMAAAPARDKSLATSAVSVALSVSRVIGASESGEVPVGPGDLMTTPTVVSPAASEVSDVSGAIVRAGGSVSCSVGESCACSSAATTPTAVSSIVPTMFNGLAVVSMLAAAASVTWVKWLLLEPSPLSVPGVYVGLSSSSIGLLANSATVDHVVEVGAGLPGSPVPVPVGSLSSAAMSSSLTPGKWSTLNWLVLMLSCDSGLYLVASSEYHVSDED